MCSELMNVGAFGLVFIVETFQMYLSKTFKSPKLPPAFPFTITEFQHVFIQLAKHKVFELDLFELFRRRILSLFRYYS